MRMIFVSQKMRKFARLPKIYFFTGIVHIWSLQFGYVAILFTRQAQKMNELRRSQTGKVMSHRTWRLRQAARLRVKNLG